MNQVSYLLRTRSSDGLRSKPFVLPVAALTVKRKPRWKLSPTVAGQFHRNCFSNI